MTDYSADLDLALHLAEISDEITMDRYGSDNLVVDSKPDLTPVTDADLAVERRIREEIQAYRSDDAILGEEFGGEVELNGRQWVIDPIDGTKNFVRDTPVWATLISLLDNGEPVVGVISAPGLARRWWAAKDMGAWRSFNGKAKELRTSFVTDVSDSSISISSLIGWKEIGLRDQLIDFTDKAWRLRGYGDFYSYCLVAQGSVDIAMEPAVNLWDLAAPAILVREAGGEFTSITGEPGPNHGSALASNGKLHKAALDALKK